MTALRSSVVFILGCVAACHTAIGYDQDYTFDDDAYARETGTGGEGGQSAGNSNGPINGDSGSGNVIPESDAGLGVGGEMLETVVTDGLIAEWRFNQSQGSEVMPTAGSCNNCTMTLIDFDDTSGADAASGWISASSSPVGGALRLDGDDDHLTIDDEDQLFHGWSAFTIEVWARFAGSGGYTLWSAGRLGYVGSPTNRAQSMYLTTLNGGALETGVYQDPVVSDPSIQWRTTDPIVQVGEWQQIMAIFGDGNVRYILDGEEDPGVEQYTSGTVASIANPTDVHRIGANANDSLETNHNFMDGDLAVIRIYDRALSADEGQASWLAGAE